MAAPVGNRRIGHDRVMSKLRSRITTSLDGYVAGPNPTLDDPLGEGGEEIHEWAFATDYWNRTHGREGGDLNASSQVLEEFNAGLGATIMGRKMFGGGPGPWNEAEPWTGWWGENPPYHHPVFVLTHQPREPVEMQGGTVFNFVTDGIESALEQARDAAGEGNIWLAGGAEAIQQYLAAGLVDELTVHVAPILLGGGTRLFDNLGPGVKLEQVAVIEAPGVTHLRYRPVG